MPTYLDAILALHREEDRARRADLVALEQIARSQPQTRDLLGALRQGAKRDGIAVIAEIKRRSPSRGDLSPGLDPTALATSYASAGASCLSVLTDAAHFGGSPEDLQRARRAVHLPVLRKDFTVSPADVFDARIMGADAILLIVAALDDRELRTLHHLATEHGLGVLVEVHDEHELDRALAIGAGLVGVNQRDLHTFAIDPERALRMGETIPADIFSVAESGISRAEEVSSLVDAGFGAILVGEALVTSDDPAAVLRCLRGEQIAVNGGAN